MQEEKTPVSMEATENTQSSPPTDGQLPKENHHLIWIVVVAVAVLVLVLSITYFQIIKNPQEVPVVIDEADTLSVEDLPPVVSGVSVACEEYDNGTANAAAIDTGNIEYCDCITENDDLQKSCTAIVRDITLSESARQQFDESLCEEVVDEAIKTSCIDTVVSGIEYLKEVDPQYLAHAQAAALSDNAIADLEALIDSDPENLDNILRLSLLYSGKGLTEQEKGGDQTPFVQKALALVEQGKELYPNESEVYRVEGYAYEIMPDFPKALASYEKAIEINPESPHAYLGRGHTYNLMGILEDALSDFRKASELDPENEVTAIYSNLCRLTSSRDDLQEEAIGNCNIVIQNNDDIFSVVQTHQVLASMYSRRGDFEQAKTELLKAEGIKPNDANLQISLAEINIFEGNFEEAQTYAEKAVQLTPTKSKAYYALAYSLHKQEKYNEAIEQALKGVELVEQDVSLLVADKPTVLRDLYFTIANSYEALGDNENAQKYGDMGEAVFTITVEE